MRNSKPSSSTSGNKSQVNSCPMCGGAGFLRQDYPIGHPEFGKIIPCKCHVSRIEEDRLHKLRTISNLDALGHYTFDNFSPEGVGIGIAPTKSRSLTFAFNAAREFSEKPRGWLTLLGGYGCGKTHLAVAIANSCIERGESALFVVVPDLLDHLRATYGPHSATTYDERFEQIRSAPLLVLDDLGTQASTPWAQEKLFQIFNYRYNTRLPTVITSNHNLEEIDRRIRSRLADPDFSRVFTILAPDFRAGGETLSELSTLDLHADKTFETFDLRTNSLDREKAENLRQAYNLARNFAQNPADWILFTGSFGCGKTHLAAAIANQCTDQGLSALFIVVPDLLDHLRAAFSPSSLTPYDKRFEEVRNAPMLVLDDLGTQSATPWAQEKLYQLFNHRYNARLPTVITMADATELDPRLKSRLLDVGRCTAIAVTASSYRGAPSLKLRKTRNRSGKRSTSTGKRY